jgi:hypothetical protein
LTKNGKIFFMEAIYQVSKPRRGLIFVAQGDSPELNDKDQSESSFGVYFCGEANKNYDKTIPLINLFGSGLVQNRVFIQNYWYIYILSPIRMRDRTVCLSSFCEPAEGGSQKSE